MATFCENKVAVVTGAGGTLCSCIAIDLAEKGAKVVLIGRTASKLEKTAAEITAKGGVCRIEPADVTDEAAIQDIADRVLKEWGPCKFLVNGAGGNNVKAMPSRLRYSEADLTPTTDFDKDRGFWDIDMAAFKSVLEINTIGTVIPSKVFGKQMAVSGGGSILNFGSMNTYRPLTRVAPYAMSKAAIANWTMFFAQYMAPAKVRVNAVAPGFFVNERSKQYLMTPDGGFSPRGQQVIHHTPAGRFGEAPELLGCVEWLLDDEKAGFVTGITVPVDGGFLASAGV
ncbi:MAG: SDR family NAD(P)-dependent oxidoreductase [bacterium]|nr:SDR family NAD(P)-dependent oxidoreductase [bacterium]